MSDQKNKIIVLVIAILIICMIIILLIRLRSMSQSLKSIGTLEITKSSLKKQIGDLTTIYDYQNLRSMELENYFRNLSISKPDSFTRSLKIINNNLSEEVLIISNKSIDFEQKISVSDSLKTLGSSQT